MAICVHTIDGVLHQSTTSIGSCTDYVLQTATEYAVTTPVYTYDDIVIMCGYVVTAWVTSYCIKLLRRAL